MQHVDAFIAISNSACCLAATVGSMARHYELTSPHFRQITRAFKVAVACDASSVLSSPFFFLLLYFSTFSIFMCHSLFGSQTVQVKSILFSPPLHTSHISFQSDCF